METPRPPPRPPSINLGVATPNSQGFIRLCTNTWTKYGTRIEPTWFPSNAIEKAYKVGVPTMGCRVFVARTGMTIVSRHNYVRLTVVGHCFYARTV